jgi:hypothetical protein
MLTSANGVGSSPRQSTVLAVLEVWFKCVSRQGLGRVNGYREGMVDELLFIRLAFSRFQRCGFFASSRAVPQNMPCRCG